jgi:hypothetical protein
VKIARYVYLGALLLSILLLIQEGSRGRTRPSMILTGWATFLPARLPRATVNWSGVGMMLLCLGLVAGLAHHLGSWLWRSGGRTEPWRPRWTAAGLAIVILMFVAGMAVTGVAHQVGWLITEPRRFIARPLVSPLILDGLRAILKAQQEFREQDRDGNGRKGYWRQDVAGLHGHLVGGQAIKLLKLTLALADDRSRTDMSPFAQRNTLPLSVAGYYFRALRFDGESDAILSPDRFAVCAVPSSFSAGSAVFILSDAGTLYAQAYGGQISEPEVYPSDPEKSHWYRVE